MNYPLCALNKNTGDLFIVYKMIQDDIYAGGYAFTGEEYSSGFWMPTTYSAAFFGQYFDYVGPLNEV